MALEQIVSPGLEGVVAAQTNLSSVDGEAGELIIAGFPVEALATRATFEETVYLLWNDRLPKADELGEFRSALINQRSISPLSFQVLEAAARQKVSPMDALRMIIGVADLEDNRADSDDVATLAAVKLVAALPTIVAAYARISSKREPIAPRADLGHAANYLFMLSGEVPGREQVRAMETYLNTVIDHGLNASTFTARVITSTQSDLISAIVGAVGALKGPLHGGAPGPALDMVFEIGEKTRAEAILREKLQRGERLMGFGHRVYSVRDPRADVLASAAERLFKSEADASLYDLARHVEQTALRLLETYKPERKLQTNVEFYTALLLHGLKLPSDLFTPTFAIGRVAGWIAHCFEQQKQNRLIRPESVYVGVKNRRWTPLEER
jgi:citrate synthase